MIPKIIATILLSLILIPAAFGQIVDTLYTNPNMEGGLSYYECYNSVLYFPYGTIKSVGDAYNYYETGVIFGRYYVGFDLPLYPDSLELIQADLFLYQWGCMGNGVIGPFPIWDVPGGDTVFCVADHIDIGPFLYIDDWEAGDPGNVGTFQSNFGLLSSDSILGWKTLNVTDQALQDYELLREWTQFRIRFEIDTDWDYYQDLLYFCSGEHTVNPPMLVLTLEPKNSIADRFGEKASMYSEISAYPNPFNDGVFIELTTPLKSAGDLTVYSLEGKEVFSYIINSVNNPYYWEGRDYNGSLLPSGIYFVVWRMENSEIVEKIVMCK